MGISKDERERRLWARLKRTPSGCLEWQGPKFKSGYGNVKWDGRSRRVHLLVWEKLRGDRPAGLEPDHTCRNRACAEPDHLEWVTHKVNCERAEMARGSANGNGRKTHCPAGHEYTPENTRVGSKDGKRYCRTCHREDEARRAAERRRAA